MVMTLIDGHNVIRADGTVAKRVVLLSTVSMGESFQLTGSDVPGLNSDDVIAAGSVLITPDANYIAFTDGNFGKKE